MDKNLRNLRDNLRKSAGNYGHREVVMKIAFLQSFENQDERIRQCRGNGYMIPILPA